MYNIEQKAMLISFVSFRFTEFNRSIDLKWPPAWRSKEGRKLFRIVKTDWSRLLRIVPVVKHARNLFVWIVVERNKFNLNTKNVF